MLYIEAYIVIVATDLQLYAGFESAFNVCDAGSACDKDANASLCYEC